MVSDRDSANQNVEKTTKAVFSERLREFTRAIADHSQVAAHVFNWVSKTLGRPSPETDRLYEDHFASCCGDKKQLRLTLRGHRLKTYLDRERLGNHPQEAGELATRLVEAVKTKKGSLPGLHHQAIFGEIKSKSYHAIKSIATRQINSELARGKSMTNDQLRPVFKQKCGRMASELQRNLFALQRALGRIHFPELILGGTDGLEALAQAQNEMLRKIGQREGFAFEDPELAALFEDETRSYFRSFTDQNSAFRVRFQEKYAQVLADWLETCELHLRCRVYEMLC